VIGALGYSIAAPKAGEKLTEFYILGAEGKAEDYPRELAVGEEATVILGIVNHEDQEISYQIEIMIDGTEIEELGPLVLADDEKWEEQMSFVPQEASDNQRVEFLLYKSGEDEPYAALHLFIDVKE
jgi:uncharacterized membrane protein